VGAAAVIHTRIGRVNVPLRSVAGHAAAAPIIGLKPRAMAQVAATWEV
jgi:hypothetical protein